MQEIREDNTPQYEFLRRLVEQTLERKRYQFERSPDPEYDYLLSRHNYQAGSFFVTARVVMLDAPIKETYPYMERVAKSVEDDTFLILVCKENNSDNFTVKIRDKEFYTSLKELK